MFTRWVKTVDRFAMDVKSRSSVDDLKLLLAQSKHILQVGHNGVMGVPILVRIAMSKYLRVFIFALGVAALLLTQLDTPLLRCMSVLPIIIVVVYLAFFIAVRPLKKSIEAASLAVWQTFLRCQYQIQVTDELQIGEMKKRFDAFGFGGHGQKIVFQMKGSSGGNDFVLYTYRYKSMLSRKGRGRRQRYVYNHGIIIKNMNIEDFTLKGFAAMGMSPWKPNDPGFNNEWRIRQGDAMYLESYFTDKRRLALLDLKQSLPKKPFFQSAQGLLCFSYSGKSLLPMKPPVSLIHYHSLQSYLFYQGDLNFIDVINSIGTILSDN